MKLKFHLTNTGNRGFRITVLDKTLLLSRKGTRGSHAVVNLDEFRFRYRGEAAKFFEPYLAAGLHISLETDIEIHTNHPAPSAAPAVRQHTPGSVLPNRDGVGDSNQQTRTIAEGKAGISVLGHLDLAGEKIKTIDQSGGRGDKAFAAGSQSIDLGMDEPLRQTRLPHSGGSLEQPPSTEPVLERPTIADPLLDNLTKAAQKSSADDAAEKLAKTAEEEGSINLANLIGDRPTPPPAVTSAPPAAEPEAPAAPATKAETPPVTETPNLANLLDDMTSVPPSPPVVKKPAARKTTAAKRPAAKKPASKKKTAAKKTAPATSDPKLAL